jgi:hypothetical protein
MDDESQVVNMVPIDDEMKCPSEKISSPNSMKTNIPAIEEASVFFEGYFNQKYDIITNNQISRQKFDRKLLYTYLQL